jgi:hypothetical protein
MPDFIETLRERRPDIFSKFQARISKLRRTPSDIMQRVAEPSDIMQRVAEERNYYGRRKFQKYKSETALNAGVARQMAITQREIDSYGPFVSFGLQNRSGENIEVSINASYDSAFNVLNAEKTYFVQPSMGLDVTPYENGRPDISFVSVVIKNLDAVNNTSNDELTTRIANY